MQVDAELHPLGDLGLAREHLLERAYSPLCGTSVMNPRLPMFTPRIGTGRPSSRRLRVDERAVAAEDHDEVGGAARSPPRR